MAQAAQQPRYRADAPDMTRANAFTQGMALLRRAAMNWSARRFDEAETLWSEALDLGRRHSFPGVVGASLAGLAVYRASVGDVPTSLLAARSSIDMLIRASSYPQAFSDHMNNLHDVIIKMVDLRESLATGQSIDPATFWDSLQNPDWYL